MSCSTSDVIVTLLANAAYCRRRRRRGGGGEGQAHKVHTCKGLRSALQEGGVLTLLANAALQGMKTGERNDQQGCGSSIDVVCQQAQHSWQEQRTSGTGEGCDVATAAADNNSLYNGILFNVRLSCCWPEQRAAGRKRGGVVRM